VKPLIIYYFLSERKVNAMSVWGKEDYKASFTRDLDEIEYLSQFILYENLGVSRQKINKKLKKFKKKIEKGDSSFIFAEDYEEYIDE